MIALKKTPKISAGMEVPSVILKFGAGGQVTAFAQLNYKPKYRKPREWHICTVM